MDGNEDKIKIDDIDLRILRLLQRDGRISNAKLAREVGLSAPPALERVKKLERTGVIKGYHAIVDARRIGSTFVVFAAVNLDVVELSKASQFEGAVRQMPEVLECHHIAGDIDFLLKINVVDQEHYKRFVIDKLARIKGLSRIQSWVVLSTSKEITHVDIPKPEPTK
jgi:DNA-binding Lrp family transcriptional regulator